MGNRHTAPVWEGKSGGRSKISMKGQDLQELYQLLSLYGQTYGTGGEKTVVGWLDDIAARYEERGCGDIRKAANPRGAGRKRKYTPEQDAEVVRLRGEGMSLREVAAAAGVSVGHVQDVIRRKNSGI